MNYEELCLKIEHGAKFSINLPKRTLKVNGKDIEFDDPKFDESINTMPILMHDIEMRYSIYKHSVPSERSERRQRNYFKALPYEQLTDEQMCYGWHREAARFQLEFLILRALQTGKLWWDKSWGTWFWQSDTDKDLVILREWIEPQAA